MESLIKKHWNKAYRAALQVTRDPDLAQDAVQEGLSSAWQKRAQLRSPDAFGAWLSQIVRRSALRLVSQASRSMGEGLLETTVPAVERFGLDEAIARAMQQLSPEQRQVVEWVEMDGLSCVEVAGRLNLPPGTVRSRLHYAKKVLQEELKTWL